MVDHPEVAVELRVLVADGIEAVRARGDDGLELVSLERLDIALGQGLVEVLVAEAPGRLAGALLLVAQDREVHARGLQHPDESPRHLPVALVEGAVAADPVEVLGLVDLAHLLHAQVLRPVGARLPRHLPGVAVGLEVAERRLQLGREARLGEHEPAAHVHDLRHVLDEDRAGVHAPAAGGAGPQHIVVDDVADQGLLRGLRSRQAQQHRRFLEEPLPQVQDQPLRVELLAAHVGRAARGTAAALGAVVGVEEILPGHVGQIAGPEGLRVLEIHAAVLALRLERREEDVERRDQDVQVLGIGQQHQEAQEQSRVRPPGQVEDHLDRGRGEAGERLGDGAPRELPVVVGLGAEPHVGGIRHQVGHHEPQDQEQDHQGLGREVEPLRPGDEPPEERVAHRDDHERAEQVLEDQVGWRVGQERQEERLADAPAEELDGAEREDDEAPEDDRVHQPRPEVVGEQPGLAEDVDDHAPDAGGDVIPARHRLALEQEAQEEPGPPREEHDGHRDHRVEDQPAGKNTVPGVRRQHQGRLMEA